MTQHIYPDEQAHATGHFAFPVVNRDTPASTLIQAAEQLTPALAAEASLRDRQRLLPHDALEWVRKAGITAARVPREWDGPELGYQELAHIMIALAKGDPNVAQVLIPHFTSVERLRLNGHSAQHTRYFAGLRHGDVISGATGERGGKFVTDMTTQLVSTSDGLRLRGKKFYSTGGLMADLLRVTAKNDRGETVSALIPRDREGVVQHDDWDGMGQRLTASGSTDFNNVQVLPGEVMFYSSAENKRRNYQPAATQMLHSTIEVGIAFAVLDEAVEWAHRGARPRPESGVERSVDDWYVQHIIGNIAAHAHAAQATLLRAAALVDEAVSGWYGDLDEKTRENRLIAASIATAEAKIICNGAALRAAERIYDVGGSSATLKANNFDRHWRNARTHTTHDPIHHRYRVVGRYYLDQTPPPITMYD
ncbi:Acyl-CoA dehydrogenase (plasmid) [Sodalis praecaptivus]|uniref:Acyl-CoA dehydrogenase n=1 Tax=Sodalis praecaptivus TaxID=1239307 RepID=W0I407_9GAMM|nr:acyl-CoA dehydrogenase family protein [Sodalis praecaptivus]AHF79205.1 Acyl-CoA dehydrogenase [Sodalis praecaptivus]